MKWVLESKAAEATGYTVQAIRCKRSEGVWLKGIHWDKAPDGRVIINLEAVDQWFQGTVELKPGKRVSA